MARVLLRRVAVLVLGWMLVLLGIAGLALPFLQGVLLILLGLLVLSRESAWARRQVERVRRRFPHAEEKLRRAKESFARRFRFLHRRGDDGPPG